MPDPNESRLALSGGRWRVALFNLVSVWRLDEKGWHRNLDMIASVSGGSILNGVLATRWPQVGWTADDVATDFREALAQPVRAMTIRTMDVFAGTRNGACRGVETRIDAYGTVDGLAGDNEVTSELQRVRTRLSKFSDVEQRRLVNWGHALNDVVMRKRVDPDRTAPSGLPLPAYPLGAA